MICAVIGCNYGDEGKGLITDYLSSKSNSTLVVKHNGGAQAGHTVEIEDKRFVFHELSSGSFRKADTFWAKTYYPDLYKLRDEMDDFRKVAGFVPVVKASEICNITTIDDVLINMLLETSRGNERHGSCGMGINEADLRLKAGFSLSLGDIEKLSEDELTEALITIRQNYTVKRLAEETVDINSDYYKLLNDRNVLYNFACELVSNIKLIEIVKEEDTKALFEAYENIVFENGQGLLLDSEYEANWPNVTASRTGIINPVRILSDYGMKLDKACYVSRTYITKHGAGRLANEDSSIANRYEIDDQTNITNKWQGSIRFASFEDKYELRDNIKEDLKDLSKNIKCDLYLTHLNETNNAILVNDKEIKLEEFMDEKNRELFDKIHLSNTKFSKDIHEHILLL